MKTAIIVMFIVLGNGGTVDTRVDSIEFCEGIAAALAVGMEVRFEGETIKEATCRSDGVEDEIVVKGEVR